MPSANIGCKLTDAGVFTDFRICQFAMDGGNRETRERNQEPSALAILHDAIFLSFVPYVIAFLALRVAYLLTYFSSNACRRSKPIIRVATKLRVEPEFIEIEEKNCRQRELINHTWYVRHRHVNETVEFSRTRRHASFIRNANTIALLHPEVNNENRSVRRLTIVKC
jgi:hypothetical protein